MTNIPFPTRENSCCRGNSGPAILTLPVAPRPFSRIRFDPTGEPVRAVPPAEALSRLEEHLRQGAEIKAVDIDGPGDPLSEIGCTMETLRLIRKKYPGIALFMTTLGFYGEKYAKSLAAEGVSCVTLLVDAVDRKVAEKLYAWIRPGKKTVPISQAATMLLEEQRMAVRAFKEAGCKVFVRSTVYPGVNAEHIEEIAGVMAESGVEAMTLFPCRTAANRDDQLLDPPDVKTMQLLQTNAGKHLKTLLAAESDNRIGVDSPCSLGAGKGISSLPPKPSKVRPNIAVVSLSGMEVDLHLGQAYQVLIYGPREDGLTCLLGTRPVPDPGSGSSRWEELAEVVHDCFAILASSAGESPRRILGQHGITVLITDNEIEGTVDFLYGGGKKRKCKR
jgi:nitrogen fixation protein NifB